MTRLRVNTTCIATKHNCFPITPSPSIEVSKRLRQAATAFNLVSGQSTLIFIYLLHTHICIYVYIFGFLFIIKISLCVYVFYAKSIFNLPAEPLCKYQILTTNTCWLGSPKSIPHSICSSAVAFTLNCNYVYVILFAQTHTHTDIC